MRKFRQEECCCEAFLRACRDKTEGDNYYSLVQLSSQKDREGEWAIGNGFPEMKFCPWCGERVPEVLTVQEQKAKRQYLEAKAEWDNLKERAERNERAD